MKRFLLVPFVVLVSLLSGCVKDGDETIALPDPGLSSGPASNAIPDALRGRLQTAMPLHSGGTAPNVSGDYETGSLTLSNSNYKGDYTKNEFVKSRLLADMGSFNFGVGEDGKLTFRAGEGGGGFDGDSTVSVEITGNGDGFTAYIIKKGIFEGIGYKASVIISGKIKDDSIEDFHYTVILLEKDEDGENVLGVTEDTYFVFENEGGRPISRLKPVYAVSFSANGGSGTVSPRTVDAGGSVTLPGGDGLTRSGFTFAGWSLAEDCDRSNCVTSSPYKPTADITLYAVWNAVVPDNTFTDPRDNNKAYKKVKIGTQTWMAENLNYDVPNNAADVCYDGNTANCTKYGRLYDWSTATAACPAGWHLPSKSEWGTLTAYVGGASTAGTKLKSPSYWNTYPNVPAGTDEVGFSALPGGYYGNDGNSVGFHWVDDVGGWWTSTEAEEYPDYNAVYIDMGFDYGGVSSEDGAKAGKMSVRCLEGN